jgi:ubiquinone/menaquinone biosynthesis C-methylase UbiE
MDTKEVIQNYWDYRSDSYTKSVIDQSEEERKSWMEMLSEAIEGKNNLKILDVGTGPGFLALMCAEMGNEVTAVDLSESMLTKAKENAKIRGVSIDLMQGDAEKLQLPDDYFDVVMNKYLLWTLPDPTKALMEWRRVLKKGGMIIAIDGDWHSDGVISNPKSATSDTTKTTQEEDYPQVFKKHYDPLRKDLPLFSLKPEMVISCFKDAGFEDVSIEEIEKFYNSSEKKEKLLGKIDSSTPVYFIKSRKQ